ncbi:MAG: hypothetical protein P8I94_06460 [Emcibacteraceae bacterium]|nr:hypothetical protein [Emcibacteraceae bacterium]
MSDDFKKALKILIALTPCIIAMYTLHWLETSGTWIPETPHRDKFTGAILITGLGLSFFLQTYISKRK